MHQHHFEVDRKDSPLAGDGGVARHGLGRHLEVAVGAVEEALASLGEVLQDETGGGRGGAVQGRAAGTGAILHIETVTEDFTSTSL